MIEEIVRDAGTMEASDILLSQETQLFFRVDGEMQPQGACPDFISELNRLVPKLLEALKNKTGGVDLPVDIAGQRFRATVYQERTGISAALRFIPGKIIPAVELGIDSSLLDKVQACRHGLVQSPGRPVAVNPRPSIAWSSISIRPGETTS